MKKQLYFLLIIGIFGITGCQRTQRELPILGPREPIEKQVDGQTVTDTLYHQVPDFRFTDQNGQTVTASTFENKVYVTDFFFTTCPTICPVMKNNLLKVYEAYKDSASVSILSHSIDPVHDSVAVLKDYADRLEVQAPGWYFVTGNQDSIFSIARHYMVSALEDKDAPGGYAHSGALILMDKQRHIRGYYDGTEEDATQKLIQDIKILLNE